MRLFCWRALANILALASTLAPASARAGGCLPVAQRATTPGFLLAALPLDTRQLAIADPRLAAVPEGAAIQLTFLGHASFLIETPRGVSAVTDYNGIYRPPFTPTIVTMNNAHPTHYTDAIDPGIKYVLRGWNAAGGWVDWDIRERDLRVRNIPTAVRGRSGADELSNSMFIFETPEICIAHLGHLHHVLTREQTAELGQIDILLAPVDGYYTMSQEEMVDVINQVKPAVVIPMHYFDEEVLSRFTTLVARDWNIVVSPSPTVAFARASLPTHEVLVLPGH